MKKIYVFFDQLFRDIFGSKINMKTILDELRSMYEVELAHAKTHNTGLTSYFNQCIADIICYYQVSVIH